MCMHTHPVEVIFKIIYLFQRSALCNHFSKISGNGEIWENEKFNVCLLSSKYLFLGYLFPPNTLRLQANKNHCIDLCPSDRHRLCE